MKTPALVLNFGQLGVFAISILTGGLPDETNTTFLMLGAMALTVMNIIIIAGSSIHPEWIKLKGRSSYKESTRSSQTYRVITIIAVLLNISLLGYELWALRKDIIRGSGPWFIIIFSMMISVPLFSIIRISISRWNNFAGLRRTIMLTGISLIVLFSGILISMQILIGHGIKENINIAKAEYSGKAEDALLAYLADSTKSPRERTDIAIWTLGQIRSRKALPVLKELFKNDPEGNLCKGRHNTELCQYEIHKAIVSIEHNWLGAKEKNWFGSWARLNK